MTHHPPVRDFATDFDHTDPQWVADPYPIWDELRRDCPVAHTDRYGGAWLPVTHEGVAEVAYDTEHFTSRSVVVSELRPGDDDLPAPIGIAPPITSDPPFHRWPGGCCCRRSHRSRSPRSSRSPASCATSCSTRPRGSPFGCCGRIHAGHSVAGHREDARLPAVEDADIFRRFIRMILEDVDVSAEDRQARSTTVSSTTTCTARHRGAPRRAP